MAVQTQIQTRRGTAASWTSTNPTLAAGEIGFESDTGKIKIGTGSTAWNALAYTASSTAVTYLFNATGGQTTFSGTDANGLTLAYTVGSEQVYLNGVLQVRGSDYTATNGTSIVLASGALVSDVLNVIAFSALALSNTYTQAQADAKFVQQSTNFFAGKNKIINGDMNIWQRGTSINVAAASFGYGADRWGSYVGTGAAVTISRQTFTPGAAPVAGYESQYFLRYNRTTTGSAESYLYQRIEDVTTFAGQTVTISFWAKAGSAITFPIGDIYLEQNFGTGGSSEVATNVNTSTQAISTSWTRYSFTVAVPSISGKTIGTSSQLGFVFRFPTSFSTVAFDLWGVQIEAGSIATPFETATGTLQGELAACQRYYYRLNETGATNRAIGNAFYYTSTNVSAIIPLPVTMRISPALDQSTGTDYYGFVRNGAIDGFSSFTIDATGKNGVSVYNNTDVSGTAGQAGLIVTLSTAAYLGFTAEL